MPPTEPSKVVYIDLLDEGDGGLGEYGESCEEEEEEEEGQNADGGLAKSENSGTTSETNLYETLFLKIQAHMRAAGGGRSEINTGGAAGDTSGRTAANVCRVLVQCLGSPAMGGSGAAACPSASLLRFLHRLRGLLRHPPGDCLPVALVTFPAHLYQPPVRAQVYHLSDNLVRYVVPSALRCLPSTVCRQLFALN